MRRVGGFTIIELLVASAVFSVVALVALTSFIEIGRLFYRGALYNDNQQAARSVITQVTGDIGAATTISGPLATNGDNSQCPNSAICYYCVGSARYTFVLGKALDLDAENQERQNQDSTSWSHFGLLRDKLNNASDCNNPFATGATPLKKDATELLANNMRLNQFRIEVKKQSQATSNPDIRNPYGNLYNVVVDVASGDNNVLKIDNLTSPQPWQAAHPATCDANLKTAQFCAENSLSTSVAAVSPTVVPGPTAGSNTTSYTLTVQMAGGSGSLYLDGQLCDTNCSKDYPVEDPAYATIQAIPDYTNYKFDSWSGSSVCNGSKNKPLNPCTFKVSSTISLVANFVKNK